MVLETHDETAVGSRDPAVFSKLCPSAICRHPVCYTSGASTWRDLCGHCRPSYTAQAQLLIDARKVQVFQQQSILGDIPIDTAQVESQVEILKSENIASAVIKNLHLTEDPEFVGSGGGLLGALFSAVFSRI